MNANIKKAIKKSRKIVLKKIRAKRKILVAILSKINRREFYGQFYYFIGKFLKLFKLNRDPLVSAVIVFATIASLLFPIILFNQATVFAASTSKCEWTQIRQIPGTTDYTHFLNIKYGQTEDWCMNIRNSYDTTYQYGTYKSPTFTPAPVPSPSPVPTPVPSPSSEPSASPTPSPSVSPTPSPEVSPIPAPSADPTPDPSESPTPAPSADPTPTPTIEPTPTPSIEPTPSVEPTPTPSISPEPSATPAPSVEPTPTPSIEPTPTPTPVATITFGGGGSGGLGLAITSELNVETKEMFVVITWLTSHLSTSRVIYDTESGKFDFYLPPPSYGMAFYKEGDDTGVEKVISHRVTLTGLTPGETYYFRTVSVGSFIISEESSFVAPKIALANIPSPAPVPSVSPTPAPTASPIAAPASVSENQEIVYNVDLSIIDYLKSTGLPSDFDYRVNLAVKNGISNYTSSAEQNIRLLALLKTPAAQKNPIEEISANNDREKNKAPENSAVNEAAEAPQETIGSESPQNKELQAGIAGVLGENSLLSGFLNGINQVAVLIIMIFAVIIVAGKEFWIKILKKVKN